MHRKSFSLLLFYALITFTCNVHADAFADALQATSDEDYGEALDQWQKLANQGNPLAQYNLARFYERGLSVPISLQQARYWYEKAAQQGLVQAYTKVSVASIKPGQGSRVQFALTPQAWVRAQQPRFYTLQVASSKNRRLIERYYKEFKLSGQAGYYQYKRQGEDWFALVYGAYPSVKDANADVDSLPAKLRKWSPWVRQIKRVQSAMIDE